MPDLHLQADHRLDEATTPYTPGSTQKEIWTEMRKIDDSERKERERSDNALREHRHMRRQERVIAILCKNIDDLRDQIENLTALVVEKSPTEDVG